MLNSVDLNLKAIYDGWQIGMNYEKDPYYSSMFRMGFPDTYLNREHPLIMYVGQECRDCEAYKTQEWCKSFQESGRPSWPFWTFYRKLRSINNGTYVLWNNLDKFHRASVPPSNQPLPGDITSKINAQYGQDKLSILQREILLIKPDIVLFVVGNNNRYCLSMSSAFGVAPELLNQFQPQNDTPIMRINNNIINAGSAIIFWTYHPKYLQLSKKTDQVIQVIENAISGI